MGASFMEPANLNLDSSVSTQVKIILIKYVAYPPYNGITKFALINLLLISMVEGVYKIRSGQT